MTAAPRVTIGLPFHAARDTLADAIRSVFAQTFTDWELILVDDGSTDGSLEIARGVRDPRVRVVSDGVRRYLAARLNQISAMARGEFVARLDADDVMHPERIAAQLRHLESQPLDVVGTSMYALRANEVLGVLPWRPAHSPAAVLRGGLLPHATIIARRSWFRANLYDESFKRSEDRELWCRIFRTARVAVLPERLYFVRLGTDSEGILRDYVLACRENCRVAWTHRRSMGGQRVVVPMMLSVLAKAEVYRCATWLGKQEVLLRRRAMPATASEMAEARKALAIVQETAVPGLC